MSDTGLRQRNVAQETNEEEVQGKESSPDEGVAKYMPKGAARIQRLIHASKDKAPSALQPYIEKLEPVLALLAWAMSKIIPFYLMILDKIEQLHKIIPEDLCTAIVGLLVCFCGGYFPTLIAAVEAWKVAVKFKPRLALPSLALSVLLKMAPVMTGATVADGGATEDMSTAVVEEIKVALLSEESGVTTKLKKGMAKLNDAHLQTMNVLDIIGSAFSHDIPCGLGSEIQTNVLTGIVTGVTLAQSFTDVKQGMPIPVAIFSTIAEDAERLVAFLDFGANSTVTPAAILTLCAHCAYYHSIGQSMLVTQKAMGYILSCKGFEARVVMSATPGDPTGYLPFEMTKPERRKLRSHLQTVLVSQTEKVAGEDVLNHSRIVPVVMTSPQCDVKALVKAHAALTTLEEQAGQSHVSRGRRFVLRFLKDIFSSFTIEIPEVIENYYAFHDKDPMRVVDFSKIVSPTAKATTLPTSERKRRKKRGSA